MWHWTSDTHFGHANIIKYCKRPFLTNEEVNLCDLAYSGTIPIQEIKVSKKTVELMDETIIFNINKAVDKNDTLVILGDFCIGSDKSLVKSYRDRIKCKNVFLILGNHDNREACSDVFSACYENYLFNIDGQKIFASHYPARSWNKVGSGAWMLYGHVHNGLHNEDNGRLSNYERLVYNEGITAVLQRYGVKNENLINELMAVIASTKGIDLTLDVGVDNVRSGIPFGTPWNMTEVKAYMQNKINLWKARKAVFEKI